MNTKHLTGAMIMSLVTMIIVLLVLILTDLFLMTESNLGFFRILFIVILSGALLFPFFFWIRTQAGEDPITATRLSDLELNDRDVREAVNQWVYVHYGKRAEGVMDFELDENGSLVCKITVRDEQ